MRPEKKLPLPDGYQDEEVYVHALLDFVSSSELLQLLCSGVHILDFYTRSPDLYSWLLKEEWRKWFDLHNLEDLLDFILREDLSAFTQVVQNDGTWRGKEKPPLSLVAYLSNIRRLSLNRDFYPQTSQSNGTHAQLSDSIPRNIAVGMKLKKIHEVDHFSRYVQNLTIDIATTKRRNITHLVDFGSGQNYLGRNLASKAYSKHVIAVEGRHHNIEGAKVMDIHAKLAPKKGMIVNKKLLRAQRGAGVHGDQERDKEDVNSGQEVAGQEDLAPADGAAGAEQDSASPDHSACHESVVRAKLQQAPEGNGSIQYVEHILVDGDLGAVIDEIVDEPARNYADCSSVVISSDARSNGDSRESSGAAIKHEKPCLMVMSIHSCGNLSHHGIRSLTLNPSVTAIAIVGCCYNLVTERLTAPSYKLPNLRPQARKTPEPWFTTPTPGDPHGYPMSSCVANHCPSINLGITARMMAVQAPQNWTHNESDAFFTRHFFRALLQKIFVDTGVVQPPSGTDTDGSIHYADDITAERSNLPTEGAGTPQPIIIGSLRKTCYTSFINYVRGALAKVVKDSERGILFEQKMGSITDAEIMQYEEEHKDRKKYLSIVWTLMAYSAALVEAVIVVDRWCWLKEQDEVQDAWVEAVFDYGKSPRNLVVVGIKK